MNHTWEEGPGNLPLQPVGWKHRRQPGLMFGIWVWDKLGTWNPLLQNLHLDPSLLQMQNTKKLYGTKNNCVNAPLGQILDWKIQRQKTQLPFLKSWAQKQGTALNTIEGWANHLSPTSSLTLAYTSPQIRKKLATSVGEQAREAVTCFHSFLQPAREPPQ